MILLAIDTSMASCSACVYDSTQNKILAEERQFMERGHAEALPPMVAKLMATAKIDYNQLHRIAVTTGPGTFTGIRIGLAFARSLGLALNIKVLGLNSMVATQMAISEAKTPVFVVHKAGNSGFYYFYNSIKIEILNLEAVLERLSGNLAILIGSGADDMAAVMAQNTLIRRPEYDLPQAAGFAAYAASLPEPNHMPEATYLREADAKPQAALLRPLAALTIVRADATAIGVLVALHAACFDEGWHEQAITSLLAIPGTVALLAQSGDEPAGLLIYRQLADEAEILTLGVHPTLRRRGAGAALLQALLAEPISQLFLEVSAKNEDALKLYARHGFTQVGLRKAYYKSGEDAVVLRRQSE